MSRSRNRRAAWMQALLALLTSGVFGAEAPNSRMAQLDEQIAYTRSILAEATNETERVQWRQRLALQQQDRTNLQERILLDEKERRLAVQQKRHAVYSLREALRTIDTDMTAVERETAVLNQGIRGLRAERAELEQSRHPLQSEAEANAEKIAEIDQRLRALDEEIVARSLERDKAEIRVRLISEASRIEETLRNQPINPRITLGLLRERRRQADAAAKQMTDTTDSLALCRQRKQDIAAALALTEEKVAHADAELALLEKKRHGVRDWFGMRPLFYAANMEKKYLSRRLESQQQQLAAVNDTTNLYAQLLDLYEKEHAFLAEDFASVMNRYWRRLATPVVAIAAILLAHLIFSRLLLRWFAHGDQRIVGRRLSGYAAALLIVAALATFFFEDLKSVATVLGIASAAVVIALQDMFSSFAGWFVLVTSRKFTVGHRVEIDGHCGDVIDIQILRTTLLEVNNWLGVDEPTGRIIVVPNSFVFKSKFFNYTHMHPFVWHKLDVTVTYETPAREAHDLLRRILEEETRPEFEEARKASTAMERLYGVPDSTYEPKIYSIIADSGVLFRLIYVAHYRRVSSTQTRLNDRIIREFERDPRMQFAYPTERHIPTPEKGTLHVALDRPAP